MFAATKKKKHCQQLGVLQPTMILIQNLKDYQKERGFLESLLSLARYVLLPAEYEVSTSSNLTGQMYQNSKCFLPLGVYYYPTWQWFLVHWCQCPVIAFTMVSNGFTYHGGTMYMTEAWQQFTFPPSYPVVCVDICMHQGNESSCC